MSNFLSSGLVNFLDQVPFCVSLRPLGDPYLFLNRAARDFFSVPSGTLSLRPIDIFPVEYAHRVEMLDNKVVNAESKFWFHDHLQPRRAGEERWVNESMFSVRFSDEENAIVARFFLPYFDKNPGHLPRFIYQELRKVLDALKTTGIFVKDNAGRFVYVNRALAKRLERKRRDILGKTDAELINSQEQVIHFVNDDQTLFLRAAQQGRKSKMTIGDEPLTSPSGRKFILNTQKQIVWYDNEPRYIVGLANDVTEIRHHQAELEKKKTELEEEHRFLTTILSSVSEAIYALDKNSRFLWANSSFKQLFKLNDTESLVGKEHGDVFKQDLKFSDRMQRDDRRAVIPHPFEMPDSHPKPILTTFLDSTGQERQLSIVRQTVFKTQDRAFNLVVSIREIPNQWYNAGLVIDIFDSLPQCVFFKDLNFKFARVNKSFIEWHRKAGLSSFQGKTDYDIWKHRPDLADGFRHIDQKVIETRLQDGPREERHIFHTGEERIISTTKFPLFSEHGEVMGIVGVFEDVTEIEQERQFRLFREVADDLGHGMMTWINSLENNIEAINLGIPIKGPVERMKKVVRQLQTFVNFTISKTSLENCEYNPVNLVSVVRAVVDIFDDEAINCVIPFHEALVMGNEFHLMNVIHELVSNSARFRQEKTTITLDRIESQFQITISDDGTGFNTKHPLARYVQGGLSVPINNGHSGMGLAYVKKVAESHGGTITIKNNNGAHVTLLLPINPAKLEAFYES